MSVALELRLDSADAVPDSTARAAYRVVQEGLTNARKHAPASAVEVEVARGDRDSELTVSVVNRPAVNGAARPHDSSPVAAARVLSLPGAGTGLIGLAERVRPPAGASRTRRPRTAGTHCGRTLPAPRMSGGERVRVLIVDDDALVRSGLRLMLSGGASAVEVVAEADDGSGVLAAVDAPSTRRRADGPAHAQGRRPRRHRAAAPAAAPAARARAHHVRRRRARASRAPRRRRRLPARGLRRQRSSRRSSSLPAATASSPRQWRAS